MIAQLGDAAHRFLAILKELRAVRLDIADSFIKGRGLTVVFLTFLWFFFLASAFAFGSSFVSC